MTDAFDRLKSIIQSGNYGNFLAVNSHDFPEACHQNLLNALKAVGSPNQSGMEEIAGLIRHVLRREDEDLQGGIPQSLSIPRRFPYPSERETWLRCGIDILDEKTDHFLLCARPWRPEWLDLGDRYLPEQLAFAEKPRRNYPCVPGDPFLALVARDSYRSAGQREAIRAVLTAPEKSTLVINLPTGSGKSLCAQLPALLKSQTTGVSVVVVPTTALALDQERALQPFIIHPTAYYGDESTSGQQRRNAIRQRIRQGTQRIVFTSPESLIQSLSPSLYQAADLGLLRYFVIDEAHMVEQWGEGFRPAFQEMPGLRQDLLRRTSFNTLLLTATLTESCLQTLETFFGQPGEFQVISAVQLRPEPSYWFAKCANENVRRERLLEAVHHLPRPLIIYASTREDVSRWADELQQAGFSRYGVMTGKSTPEERKQLISDWCERKIDIVVATSAFGLGVDRGDVRAVIHVCIPETIDRFYQEVGRVGRDGKAAISLTLYTDDDYKIAQHLNEKSTITIERGLQRWRSMFERKQVLSNGCYRVSIDIPPSMLPEDIDMDSQQNRAWNSRTLTLMSQAGLIAIDWENPLHRSSFTSEADYQHAYNSRIIRTLDEYHLNPDTWELKVEHIRQRRQALNYQNLSLMKEASQRPNRCFAEIFEQAYAIPARAKHTPRKSVKVSRACGGCPFCRQQKVASFSEVMPSPLPIWGSPHFALGEQLKRLFAGEKLMLVFYNYLEAKQWRTNQSQIIEWLIQQGINNIVFSDNGKESVKEVINQFRENSIFLFDNYQPIKMPAIPTLILHPPAVSIPQSYLCQSDRSSYRIILLPNDTPDPNRDDRKLIDVFNGRSFRIEVFCKEIGL
ncbi:protein DpdF [Aliterella atlantica]|uniref:protein DpdF n=1 Tax=Aliterella atlantica TaxID=1827278 RepID=UPI0006986C10|nr:protein DpdF [Aliterella atlantica]